MISLAELSDREEIRTFLIKYARCLDERRLEDYAALFAEHGVWTGSFGTAEGREAILAMMREAFADSPNPPENRSFHLVSNILSEIDGDTATAWSRWTFYVKGEDGLPKAAIGGYYEDDLIREKGEWKFLRRLAMNDIPYADPREAGSTGRRDEPIETKTRQGE